MSEGLKTSIWGPPTWEALHCITFNYPQKPTKEDKKNYKLFFESLQYVLPCSECKKHYAKNIKNESELNKAFESRDSLTKWLYKLHNKVNDDRKVNYKLSYQEVKDKYESYIVKCYVKPEMNSIPYKHAYNYEAPVVDHKLISKFGDYAEERGLDDFVINIAEINNLIKKGDIGNAWNWRNQECWNMIKQMRLQGISSIEIEGKYKGMPTVSELGLMQLLCSNLNLDRIRKLIKKIDK